MQALKEVGDISCQIESVYPVTVSMQSVVKRPELSAYKSSLCIDINTTAHEKFVKKKKKNSFSKQMLICNNSLSSGH